MDVYVDSTLALAATRITLKHAGIYDRDSHGFREWLQRGKGYGGLRMHFTESFEESMRINDIHAGAGFHDRGYFRAPGRGAGVLTCPSTNRRLGALT